MRGIFLPASFIGGSAQRINENYENWEIKNQIKKDTFKKCRKKINDKILSLTLLGEMTQPVPLFLFLPSASANIICYGWNSEACVVACQEASHKYIRQPGDALRLHYM